MRAAITRPRAAQGTQESAIAEAEAAATNLDVVAETSIGLIVEGSEAEFAALAERGYRVSYLGDPDEFKIHGKLLHRGEVDLPPSLRVPRGLDQQWRHNLVQLEGPPDPDWIRQLEATGIEVLGRQSEYTLFVVADPERAKAAADLPFVRWTAPVEPGYRIHPVLEEMSGTIRNVRVAVYPPDDMEGVAKAIRDAKGVLVQSVPSTGNHGEPAYLIAALQRRQLSSIARHPSVASLEFAGTEPGLDGERETQILAENFDTTPAPNTAPVVGYQAFLAGLGVTGAGETVAICDTGVDANANNNATGHTDLRGRQAANVDYSGGTTTTDTNGHGSHVAGIAVGNAATAQVEGAAPGNFLWGQGAAPGAQYVTQNGLMSAAWPPAAGFGPFTRDALTNGATVQNNSWWDTSTTAPNPGGYNANARTYDQLVRQPSTTMDGSLCIVFSAGNWGGAASTISPPHEAKNPIIVGNSLTSRPALFPGDDVQGLNGSSSRGPAQDGRVLPVVVAPGTNVSSVWSETGSVATYGNPIAGTGVADPANPGNILDQYQFMTGTSMSAPHVVGACALMGEWWRIRAGGARPSPAMAKALLVNGAEDLAGGQNWRRIRTERWVASGPAGRFQAGPLGFVPTQVTDWNNPMQQVASLANLTANGRWFYNAATDTIFIRRGAAPGNAIQALDQQAIANVPNNDQGWGRVSIPNMFLQSPGSDRGAKLFSDQRHALTNNGDEVVFRVAPEDTGIPLRVTLAWSDRPALAGANPAIQNNLNLEVTEMSTGTIYRGNVFANGMSAAGGTFDNLNNVECVYVQAPAGVYEIAVIANALTGDARPPFDTTPWQDFALVIDNAEFAAADPVSIALCIDRSDSMRTLGYVDTTRDATRLFIDTMRVDDAVGVVGFGSTATFAYGSAADEVVEIEGSTERNAAKGAVNGLTFAGCTFMGQGLEKSEQMVSSVTGGRAIVLFSDGFDNKGCDQGNAAKPWATDVAAGLPGDLPVYTCAMGPTADQSTLELIASSTDGRYYYMPTIDDLKEIYNFIRGQLTSEGVIVNESSTASFAQTRAYVENCSRKLTFGIAWNNARLRWTGGDPKRASDMSVRLRDPRGVRLSPDDAYIHRRIAGQHVVFTVENPLKGEWTVEVETARDDHTPFTVGGFVESPIRVEVNAPSRARVGEPVEVSVHAFDGKKPITSLRVKAELMSPEYSLKDALRRYARTLDRIDPDRGFIKDGFDDATARFATLWRDRNEVLPTRRVLLDGSTTAPSTSSPTLRPGRPGSGVVIGEPVVTLPNLGSPSDRIRDLVRLDPDLLRRIRDLLDPPKAPAWTSKFVPEVAGGYSIRLHISGESPECGRFERVENVSLVVREGR